MFYRNGVTIRNIVTFSIIEYMVFIPALFWKDNWKYLWFLLLVTLITVLLGLSTERMNITSEGITCKSSHEILFSCSWENIQKFEHRYHGKVHCIDIIPVDAKQVKTFKYCFSITEPNFYFQLTHKSKKIITQYCPSAELIQQLEKPKRKSCWRK